MSSWRDPYTVRRSSARTVARVITQVVIALVIAVAIGRYRYTRIWTPLQRAYLSAYVWTTVAMTREGAYPLLQIMDRQGHRLAIEDELVPAILPSGETSFALTDAARKTGALRLAWRSDPYDHTRLHAWLAHWIYRDQTLFDLARPALCGGLVVFIVGPLVTILSGAARARAARISSAPRQARGGRIWPFTRRERTTASGLAPPSKEPSPDAIPLLDGTSRRQPRPRVRPRPFFE